LETSHVSFAHHQSWCTVSLTKRSRSVLRLARIGMRRPALWRASIQSVCRKRNASMGETKDEEATNLNGLSDDAGWDDRLPIHGMPIPRPSLQKDRGSDDGGMPLAMCDDLHAVRPVQSLRRRNDCYPRSRDLRPVAVRTTEMPRGSAPMMCARA
jgi:hypothetical protein